jgi:hypothetical protein
MADTSDPPRFGVADSPHAPFIYYEAAPAIGIDFEVIQITLSAHRLLSDRRTKPSPSQSPSLIFAEPVMPPNPCATHSTRPCL